MNHSKLEADSHWKVHLCLQVLHTVKLSGVHTIVNRLNTHSRVNTFKLV